MFVFPQKFILKTCGTTTLLSALPKILEIAKKEAGLEDIDALFYSRKAFLFPEKQDFPHGDWDSEVTFLDNIFVPKTLETSGYVLGKVNPTSRDNWNLYIASPPGGGDHEVDEGEDVTLEIMMLGLDEEKMKLFCKDSYGPDATGLDIYVSPFLTT
jgi:hypothetical protein